jgi:stringent starvation protein B
VTQTSTKPYLIRAIYEWCADLGYTPYLSVKVDQHTRVPLEYVKNGEIVLNVSMTATRNLTMNNDLIQFSARFNGVSREVSVPIQSVSGIFARENGEGMFFQPEDTPGEPVEVQVPAEVHAPVLVESGESPSGEEPQPPKPTGRGKLKLVK